MRLYCLPYAGGSPSLFREWGRSRPAGITIVPVQLPGRGPRFAEPAATSSDALVASLLPWIDTAGAPFAFFGHSMGALVAFELARALRARRLQAPVALFVSACDAPAVFKVEPKIHGLPDDEFLRRLRRLSGTPQEVLDNREMMDLLLPGLRADFAVCETYEYRPDRPLACPIVAFGGERDTEVTLANLDAWRAESLNRFTLRMFPGDHFFVLQHWHEVLAFVARCLAGLAGVRPRC